jgi:hypothetical protein
VVRSLPDIAVAFVHASEITLGINRMLIDSQLQRSIGFTNHALERFAERAGIGASSWREVETILRDLLSQEGRVVHERPHWARSRNTADAYIQVGEWLLLICRHDELRRGAVSVVTIVNGPEGNTWQRALELGYIATPMPQRLTLPQRTRTSLWESVKIARRTRGPDRIISRVVRVHRARLDQARAIHEEALRSHHETVLAYETQRKRAREAYVRRYGTAHS